MKVAVIINLCYLLKIAGSQGPSKCELSNDELTTKDSRDHKSGLSSIESREGS